MHYFNKNIIDKLIKVIILIYVAHTRSVMFGDLNKSSDLQNKNGLNILNHIKMHTGGTAYSGLSHNTSIVQHSGTFTPLILTVQYIKSYTKTWMLWTCLK